MARFVEIAVRLLSIYGLVLIGPNLVTALDRMSHVDIGMRALAIILLVVVSSIIPGLLWLMAPRIARAATKSGGDDGAVSFNLSVSDALVVSIVVLGLVVLCSAATNVGQVIFWFARSPFVPEAQEGDLLVRFKYDMFVREHVAMLAVRAALGGFLLLRAQPIADKILKRYGSSS